MPEKIGKSCTRPGSLDLSGQAMSVALTVADLCSGSEDIGRCPKLCIGGPVGALSRPAPASGRGGFGFVWFGFGYSRRFAAAVTKTKPIPRGRSRPEAGAGRDGLDIDHHWATITNSQLLPGRGWPKL